MRVAARNRAAFRRRIGLMNIRFAMLAFAAAAALVVGCGGGDVSATETGPPPRKEGSRKAWITLDGNQTPANIGILMAEKRGFFDDVGIEATITTPVVPENALAYLEEGSIDFAVSSQPEVALKRDRGAPVIAVGSVIGQPTAAMIWLKRSKIHGLADLAGKTIAVPRPFSRRLLEIVLGRVGLSLEDVEVKRVTYDLMPTLVSGRADAIFGGSWNLEGAALEARGLEPVVTPVEALGVPGYDELVIAARSAFAAKDPALVRDFLAAVAEGTAAAVVDPEAAAALLDKSVEADTWLSRK